MADWKTEVFENEYLADGATDVHAIVSITCSGAGTAGQSGGAPPRSSSSTRRARCRRRRPRSSRARRAATAAIDEIVDGTWFAVIAGDSAAQMVYPSHPGMTRMDAATRARGEDGGAGSQPAVARRSGRGSAATLFASVESTQRHAILLTDGKNESEPTCRAASSAVEAAQGVFQCDCRGVGADWDVNELRDISSALLGTVDIIPEPEHMADDFRQMMRTSMGRGVADATLRVWAPQGAEVEFVRQVAPTIEDLSDRAVQVVRSSVSSRPGRGATSRATTTWP